jgi:hypothetical protein
MDREEETRTISRTGRHKPKLAPNEDMFHPQEGIRVMEVFRHSTRRRINTSRLNNTLQISNMPRIHNTTHINSILIIRDFRLNNNSLLPINDIPNRLHINRLKPILRLNTWTNNDLMLDNMTMMSNLWKPQSLIRESPYRKPFLHHQFQFEASSRP